jgi:hypothetical protein
VYEAVSYLLKLGMGPNTEAFVILSRRESAEKVAALLLSNE